MKDGLLQPINLELQNFTFRLLKEYDIYRKMNHPIVWHNYNFNYAPLPFLNTKAKMNISEAYIELIDNDFIKMSFLHKDLQYNLNNFGELNFEIRIDAVLNTGCAFSFPLKSPEYALSAPFIYSKIKNIKDNSVVIPENFIKMLQHVRAKQLLQIYR